VPKPIERALVWIVLLYRRLRYGYEYRLIPLTQGEYAKVDPEDYEWLMQYNWTAIRKENSWYATRSMSVLGKSVQCYMHRMIMFYSNPNFEIRNTKQFVDHKNHDGRDNRKANLRIATAKQNCWNRNVRRGSSSKYIGVSWLESRSKWQVTAYIGGKSRFIGYFEDEETAARAYDAAVLGERGEFAVLNFPKLKPERGWMGAGMEIFKKFLKFFKKISF
jgi:hypothetical protein